MEEPFTQRPSPDPELLLNFVDKAHVDDLIVTDILFQDAGDAYDGSPVFHACGGI
jgi:hypothetical protein